MIDLSMTDAHEGYIPMFPSRFGSWSSVIQSERVKYGAT
jgi:hypothetical protein